jgi:aspartyl-tRNA(Asn)/glutamyl-tRNA(Gln) amidotransferase subunit C
MCYFYAFEPDREGIRHMTLHRSDVEDIAHLARIQITEEERDRYARDLNDILGLVEQMGAIDTASISPMAHPLHMAQRLRPDEAVEPNRRELFQGVAPATADGLYLVPRVVE